MILPTIGFTVTSGGDKPETPPGMSRFAAYVVMVLAILLGGGSLLLFGAFLVLGPFNIIRWSAPEFQILAWDGCLCLLFFLQHSVMIRHSFRAWIGRLVPEPYYPAVYALASGMALTAVVLLWQKSPTMCFTLPGSWSIVARIISALAIGGFVWGVRALGVFDPFGRLVLQAHLRGGRLLTLPLVVRGPYLWVRHPLYSCMLVLIWSVPQISLDRLVFNALWTAWIMVGTILEERDLVTEFGDRYRRYQKVVPMLVPWQGPVGRRQPGS